MAGVSRPLGTPSLLEELCGALVVVLLVLSLGSVLFCSEGASCSKKLKNITSLFLFH